MRGKKHYIIPIFVPHLGCLQGCIFCNQQKITGQHRGGYPSLAEIKQKIHSYLATVPSRDRVLEVAYYGGSFTALPLNLQSQLLEPATKAVQDGIIDKIRLSTRPDCLDEQIIENLIQHRVNTIELGVQSFSDNVLKIAKRGHLSRDVIRAVGLIRQYPLEIGIQLMIGLPGETDKDLKQSTEMTIQLHPDFVRIYPVLVISGTELAELFLQGLYLPLTLEEAVMKAKKMVLAFREKNIPVIRVGLQMSNELSVNSGVLAGPVHPSFRHLVESELYRDKLISFLKTKEEKKWLVSVHPRDVSNFRGIKNSNLKHIEQNLNKKIVKLIQDETIPRGELVIAPWDEKADS